MSVVAFEELPENVRMLAHEFVVGVREVLGENLHGVYMYGATVFPDLGRPSDIDCHVVLEAPLTREQRGAIEALHARLAQDFPPLGAELDVFYVLRKEAEGRTLLRIKGGLALGTSPGPSIVPTSGQGTS
jgi:predicted nucleotidyltransferase